MYTPHARKRKDYFLTLRTWLTRFSITPSKASFSPTRPSRRLSQCSSTALARWVTCSNSWTCNFNSASVRPPSAASVVAHSRRTAERSMLGGDGSVRREVLWRGGGPFSGSVWAPSLRTWLVERGLFAPVPSRSMEGRMSFFCFEAGRISSRSTGTPNDTRNRRRMRDLTQF